jgi:micrococcal nuclease
MIPVLVNWKALIPAIVILFSPLFPPGLLAEPSPQILPAEVLWITDGDTIHMRLQGHKEKVQLIGIVAPECRPNPKAEEDVIRTGVYLRSINEICQSATRYVKSVLRSGDQVNIELDVQKRDWQGRLLGYVWVQDGRLLNEEIIRAGFAGLMTYPPNIRHLKRLQEAYREAREAKRGLWTD